MAIDLDREKRLSGLSAEARARVETALREAMAKEGVLAAAGFDRGPFDRSGYDRSSKELTDIDQVFAEKATKGANPAR
jgi:hypothetical protein